MSKDKSKNNATQTTLLGILKRQSFLLLISMFLSFTLMFLIETFHYANNVFAENVPNMAYSFGMAFAVALMIQFCRVSFGIAGAYEFAKGHPGKGIFGLLFSLLLTIWCSYEVAEIAHTWAKGNESLLWSAQLILFFIVWVGFALEIRLAVSISGEAKEDDDNEENTETIDETTQIAKTAKHSSNGNGVKTVALKKG